MRARMALANAGIEYEVREVVLSNKPVQMLEASPKGTVPVLIKEGEIIEESLAILIWALEQNDPDGWLDFPDATRKQMAALIEENDIEFKPHLDRYKYADRFPEHAKQHYREQGEVYLAQLETLLTQSNCLPACLVGQRQSYTDIAILPFVRQFANVDANWFSNAPYPNLRTWLDGHLDSALFKSIMTKYAPWVAGDPVTTFSTNQTT